VILHHSFVEQSSTTGQSAATVRANKVQANNAPAKKAPAKVAAKKAAANEALANEARPNEPGAGAAGAGEMSDPQAHDVGRRLRELRQSRGISLSALAKQAGVGKATLSGLEAGTRNPTLETLYAVTAALGLPLAAVLAAPRSAGTIAPMVRGSAVEATLLEVFSDDDVTYELYRIRVISGLTQASPVHHANVTEHVTVFSGVLRAGPTAAPMLAQAGEYLTWRADVPHTYQAVGPDDVYATLLMRYPRAATTPTESP
jgi:transcriptional regulator with XRE-family HTH domain